MKSRCVKICTQAYLPVDLVDAVTTVLCQRATDQDVAQVVAHSSDVTGGNHAYNM